MNRIFWNQSDQNKICHKWFILTPFSKNMDKVVFHSPAHPNAKFGKNYHKLIFLPLHWALTVNTLCAIDHTMMENMVRCSWTRTFEIIWVSFVLCDVFNQYFVFNCISIFSLLLLDCSSDTVGYIIPFV